MDIYKCGACSDLAKQAPYTEFIKNVLLITFYLLLFTYYFLLDKSKNVLLITFYLLLDKSKNVVLNTLYLILDEE